MGISDRRIAQVVSGARRSFVPSARPVIHGGSVGLRPITADGVRIIDSCGANAYVAGGHAMLGVRLASRTGRR